MTDLIAAGAIRDLILAITPSIIPQTTLTADATVGAGSVTVADASRFIPGEILLFNDALGEEERAISAVNPTTGVITCDFTGTGQTGWQFLHLSSTGVYTNLLTEIPSRIGRMVQKGDPVIFVMCRNEVENTATTGGVEPELLMHLQYHRLLIRQGEMDENVWSIRQQRLARTDVEIIATQLRTHETLNGTSLTYGRRGSAHGRRFERSWTRITGDGDAQLFVAGLDIIVMDRFRSKFNAGLYQ